MDSFNVLLLEDNPGDACLIELLLSQSQSMQYVVATYQRLADVLQALTRRQFDIALVDLTVPDSSGIDTVTTIIAQSPQLPVIVLTGMLDEELGREAVSCGAQDFIIKGEFDEQLLVRSIAYAISRQSLVNALQESENRTRKVIASNPDGIVVVDNGNVIQFVNPTAEKLLQNGAQEIVGSLFQYPCRTGSVLEIEDHSDHGVVATVEMHSVDIDWMGHPAKLLSLRDISDRVGLEKRLRFLATHDPLTGIPNRAIFEDHLNLAIHQHQRYSELHLRNCSLSVILLDLDDFKMVNDTYGHPQGDRLLVEFAQRLVHTVRESDTVARFGGDEFVIIADNVTDFADLKELILRIMHTLSQPIQLAEAEVQLTTSIGVSCYPCDGEDYPTLFKCADIALYRAKAAKNRCCFYNSQIPDVCGELATTT